jgi:predicted RNA-binding protein with PUA-like domain
LTSERRARKHPRRLPDLETHMHYWLMKTEPDAFSWQDLVRDGVGRWDGVRNHAAKLFLKSMQVGDLTLIYHSNIGKEAVGIARIVRGHYPDPTAPGEHPWVAVDVAPVKPLDKPVTLQQIKAEYGGDGPLAKVELLRQNRLSVVPLRPEEWQRLLQLAETKEP